MRNQGRDACDAVMSDYLSFESCILPSNARMMSAFWEMSVCRSITACPDRATICCSVGSMCLRQDYSSCILVLQAGVAWQGWQGLPAVSNLLCAFTHAATIDERLSVKVIGCDSLDAMHKLTDPISELQTTARKSTAEILGSC